MTMRVAEIIVNDLNNKGIQQVDIVKEHNINSGLLSSMLSGQVPFSLKVLDAVTSSLGFEPGHYYIDFINDGWSREKSRVKKKNADLLIRCAEFGLTELMEKIVDLMTKNGGFVDKFYYVAEQLLKKGLKKKAEYFYKLVISLATDRRSRSLAMSFYRMLLINYNKDSSQSYIYALKLSDCLQSVDPKEKFEAYFKVIAAFRLNDNWEYVIQYAEELADLAEKANKPRYKGDALIKAGIAARKLGAYDKALEYIDRYSNSEIKEHRVWAIGNRLIVLIDKGETSRIIDLYRFAKENLEIAHEYIDFLLDALVKNKMYDDVERFFVDFSAQIGHLDDSKNKFALYAHRCISLINSKAAYLLEMGNREGIEIAMDAGNLAASLNLQKLTFHSIEMILKNSPSHEQCKDLANIMRRIATDKFDDTLIHT